MKIQILIKLLTEYRRRLRSYNELLGFECSARCCGPAHEHLLFFHPRSFAQASHACSLVYCVADRPPYPPLYLEITHVGAGSGCGGDGDDSSDADAGADAGTGAGARRQQLMVRGVGMPAS